MATETSGTELFGRGAVVLQAALVVVVAFIAAFLVATLAGGLLGGVGLAADDIPYRVGLTVAQFLGFGVGLAAYLGLRDEWPVVTDHLRLPTLRDAGYVVLGLAAILAGAAAVGQVLSALGVETAQNQVVVAGRENPEFFLYMIPVSLLFVGPFEELLFRGVVQGLLRRVWRPASAVAVASAMFGVVHWVALTGGGSRLSYVAVAATLGLVLGAAYELSGNLVVPAAVHGAYNAVLFAVQYGAATGLVG